MLDKAVVVATIPVKNLNRAQEYYQNVLGLKPGGAFPNGTLMQAGKGTAVALYHRPPLKVEHTVAWFWVKDFDKTIQQLRNKGAKFEKYETLGAQSLGDGVYAFGTLRFVWLKDSEGNILNVGTYSK